MLKGSPVGLHPVKGEETPVHEDPLVVLQEVDLAARTAREVISHIEKASTNIEAGDPEDFKVLVGAMVECWTGEVMACGPLGRLRVVHDAGHHIQAGKIRHG